MILNFIDIKRVFSQGEFLFFTFILNTSALIRYCIFNLLNSSEVEQFIANLKNNAE